MPGALKTLMERAGRLTATPLRVRFPSGHEYRNSEAAPAFTLTFKNERAKRRTVLYGFDEVYVLRDAPPNELPQWLADPRTIVVDLTPWAR